MHRWPGVYLDERGRPGCAIAVKAPVQPDDALWPLRCWVVGRRSGNRISPLTGLDTTDPDQDDLKALCAVSGTTAGAAMLHVAAVTPEAGMPPLPRAERVAITRTELRSAWAGLSDGAEAVDLVATGSPHASAGEFRRLAAALDGCHRHVNTRVMVTAGRTTLADTAADGPLARLMASGVTVLPDLCWYSITEPVFPPNARTVVTTSGKHTHCGAGAAPDAPMDKEQLALKELQIARMALIKERTRLLNRSKTQTLAILKRQAKARLEQIKRQFTELEATLMDLAHQRPKRARAFDILCSIPGLGRITAVAILVECPEIGILTRKQIASLAGFARITGQSGQSCGKAFIQGERKFLRDSHYTPVLVAAHFNPDLGVRTH